MWLVLQPQNGGAAIRWQAWPTTSEAPLPPPISNGCMVLASLHIHAASAGSGGRARALPRAQGCQCELLLQPRMQPRLLLEIATC